MDLLNKRFTAPKTTGIVNHFNYVRLPRKLKKKLGKEKFNAFIGNDINIKLWIMLTRKNPDYCRFLIKTICEYYEKK